MLARESAGGWGDRALSSGSGMEIVYARPGNAPWNVITVAVHLAARLLEADLREITLDQTRGKPRQLLSVLPPTRRRRPQAQLVVAPEPADLKAALSMHHLWRRPVLQAAWVIDSWWDDRIPRIARRGAFDLIYVTEKESVAPWRAATGADVRWLPQGSNVLDWGSGRADRAISVQRLGRQPPDWDDDAAVMLRLAQAGLVHRGRLPFVAEPAPAIRDLLQRLAEARFTLAFSNSVDGSEYTHPTRQYMTGRWTDSLAAGCVVAGVPPQCASVDELLWDGALLDLGGTDLESAVDRLVRADEAWSPAVARRNHRLALERLDWRWRVAQVAADLSIETSSLEHEMNRLHSRVAALKTSSVKPHD